MENKASSLKKLSLWQVTIIGIAYMTPMTVFDTFGIVSGITNGHVPLAYLLALGAMLLTAWSYARFSQNSEKSGSAYSYTAESLGPKSGFFVGWCSGALYSTICYYRSSMYYWQQFISPH